MCSFHFVCPSVIPAISTCFRNFQGYNTIKIIYTGINMFENEILPSGSIKFNY